MGSIPRLDVVIDGTPTKVFFDTGAQLAYLHDNLLPVSAEGRVTDFFHGLGWFETIVSSCRFTWAARCLSYGVADCPHSCARF